MGVSTQDLMKERYALNKSFTDLKTKIETVEKEVAGMRNNLNAINGAMQIVDKMIDKDENSDKATGQLNVPEKEGTHSKEKIDKESVHARQMALDIENNPRLLDIAKKELLKEGNKWKKIGMVF